MRDRAVFNWALFYGSTPKLVNQAPMAVKKAQARVESFHRALPDLQRYMLPWLRLHIGSE